jgi:hypothetical protein
MDTCAPFLDVIGLPGKNFKPEWISQFQQARRVWVCLDPDCYDRPSPCPKDWMPAPEKLAGLIGKQAKVIRLPGKIDDLITGGVIGQDELRSMLDNAG